MGLVAPSKVSEYLVGKIVICAGTFLQPEIVLAQAKKPELNQDSKAHQNRQSQFSS